MDRIGSGTRLAGVIGNPLGHTLSPAMHNAAYEAMGLDWVYVPLQVPDVAGVEAVVAALLAIDAVGFNVTMPYKQDVFALCDHVDDIARLAGAANTFTCRDGALEGHNTDAPGLLEALEQEAGFAPTDRSVVVLGSGGAARAAVAAMVLANAAQVTVVARNEHAAASLVDEMRLIPFDAALDVAHAGEADEALLDAHLVVNATPLGMREGDTSPVRANQLRRDTLCYDMVYGTRHLPAFGHAARDAGCRYLNGLGMLVAQGALSIDIWTEYADKAPRPVMRRAAEAELERRSSKGE